MKLTNTEKDLLKFLIKYPNQWHTYHNDAKTLRAVGGLYIYKGLGVRGLSVNRQTHQLYLDSRIFGLTAEAVR